MNETSDVLDRAESLMRPDAPPQAGRRRRSYLARPAPTPEHVHQEETGSNDDDLPVLTEVVAEVDSPPTTNEILDDTRVSILAADIARAIESQVAAELPTLIEATLLTAGQELRAGIAETVETALRDFIAHRRQLRLPLDDQNFKR